MYPGSGPSGVEVIPLRPACLCIYQWSLGYNGAPRAAWREEKEALSILLYARTENVQRELQRRPGVPLYRRGPRVYKVVGARLPAGQAGGFPAEPGWLVQPGHRLLRSFRGQLGPMMTASSGGDFRLYGLITLSLDDTLGQLANRVETASCFCY